MTLRRLRARSLFPRHEEEILASRRRAVGEGLLHVLGRGPDVVADDVEQLSHLDLRLLDIVGERRRTDYVLSNHNDGMEEAFEITLRNHKTEPVEVRVAEKLYRWLNWEIIQKSADFEKVDAQNIEFPVTVPANGEITVTYRVRYNWK